MTRVLVRCIYLVLLGLFLLSIVSQAQPQPGRARSLDTDYSRPSRPGVFAVDAGGRAIHALEVGSTLHIGATGLRPNTLYEFRLSFAQPAFNSLEQAISFARVTSDREGVVLPFVLWYESGVIGCSDQQQMGKRQRPHSFRTFQEAELAHHGRLLVITAHQVERDPENRTPPMKLRVERRTRWILRLPMVPRHSPIVYASDAHGCMLNSQLTNSADLYVTGDHFTPGEQLEVSIVPNQRLWLAGDAINDVTGPSSAAQPKHVTVNRSGRFTVRAWERPNQFRGAFDIVIHRPASGTPPNRVGVRDIISFAAETGFVFYLRYPVGGPTMDIAGRPLGGFPYFEFADSFADTNDPVWGAVDPTYIPAGHTGGTYAAYYVVNHRDVAGWDPGQGGSIALNDVSGGIEIHPVKSWCVNGTDVIIWPAPLTDGKYDVVVDFGQNPAATPAQFATDGQYNSTVDFLDGADQIGFMVAKDPYEVGTTPIGQAEYSQDDFFPTLGTATNVDLRAVVRYPATAAGLNTPVAAGQHPLFLIEHGNHSYCNVPSIDHSTCTSRKENHKGYMHLLDALASNGIIAVSIDAYDLTGPVPGWIPERGTLILKHIELWSHMNNPATYTSYPDFFSGRFGGHVDMSKIQVSGHSRGGEASVAAYMLNNNTFSINSVSSIAPVDFQSYVLPDVPYFVILPAADGDVWDLEGLRIYDRAGRALPTPDGTLKSGIDVYGASHNFFNTIWAADGDDGTPARPDYIPAAQQQMIGESYLAAFARTHLNNELVYLDMLRGKLRFPSVSSYKIYPFHHEKNHSKIESGSSVGAASGGATAVSVNPPDSVHQTAAVQVGWPSGTAQLTYTVPAAQRDASSFEVLSFRVAQTNSATNPAVGDQGFMVELVGGGKTKGTYSGTFGHIPKPYNHDGSFQDVMTTLRIPLQSFIMNNSGVTLNNIDTIRFSFIYPTQGEIYVDDIEFSR